MNKTRSRFAETRFRSILWRQQLEALKRVRSTSETRKRASWVLMMCVSVPGSNSPTAPPCYHSTVEWRHTANCFDSQYDQNRYQCLCSAGVPLFPRSSPFVATNKPRVTTVITPSPGACCARTLGWARDTFMKKTKNNMNREEQWGRN